jgi:hypothetical protein
MNFYPKRLFMGCDPPKEELRRRQNVFLQHLPKRISALDQSSDSRETFWGLYARDDMSLVMILCLPLAFICVRTLFCTILTLREEEYEYVTAPLLIFFSSLSVFVI